MKNSLKALAVCAGLFAFGAPAFAQSPVLPHTAAPHAGMAQAAPQDQAPSYDQVKAAFKKMVGEIKTDVNGQQVQALITDMNTHIDALGKLEKDYVAAKEATGTKQADLDAIVLKYTGEVKAVQKDYMQMAAVQSQLSDAVNAGLAILQQIDDKRAQSDADIKAMVEDLTKTVTAKFGAPMDNAEKVVGPLMSATQRAVQARMPAIVSEELNRAVTNQLETKAAQ